MCPVIISSKHRYTGTVTPPALEVAATVVDIPPQADDYMVEGYIDLSPLAEGDSLEVSESIALDGAAFRTFASVVYSGPVDEPVIRFHTKTLPYNARYRVTIRQLTGALRSIYYAFILEVLGVV